MKLLKTMSMSIIMMISYANGNDYKPVLNLEQEIYLTDKSGIANPNTIIRLKPPNNIKIYLPDGTELIGIVTKTEDLNREIFKVFGDIQNKPNAGFGFVLTKDGIFAGAVVYRDSDTVFTLKYSEDLNGYLFIKTIKKKEISLNSKKIENFLLTDDSEVL